MKFKYFFRYILIILISISHIYCRDNNKKKPYNSSIVESNSTSNEEEIKRKQEEEKQKKLRELQMREEKEYKKWETII